MLKGIKSSLIDNFSLLKSHKMRVETLPEVLSWRAKYSLPYKMFEYRPPFEFRSLGRRARLESRHPAHSSVGGRRGRLSFNMGTARGKWTGTFPKLTLTYFPIMGRAEPIRLAAAIGGVPFTNKAVTREEWAGIKRHTPLGQLPTLSVLQPGKEYLVAPHAVAILRYIGKLSGLYPLDDIEAVHVEFMIETIVEVISMLEVTVTGTVKSLIFDELWEEDQILEIQRRLASNQECGLPFFLRFFESVLERSKWLVGKNLTIADLTLYHLVGWLDGSLDSGIYGGKLGAVDSSILDDYPLVRQHKELVQNYPGATAFHSKYSPPYCTFDFQPPINERENDLGQQQLDNLPKGVRRQKSKELGVPKRRTTPSRKQNFSAPSPVRRRPTQSEGDKDLLEGNKKTDKLLSVPLRKKETFDYYSSIDNDDVDDHNESESKLRTLLFQNESEDNLDISFSDDTEDDYNPNDSRTSLLGSSQSVLLASPKKTREELWDSFRDDSSTTSFDDDSSISSIEHDLETLKNSTLKEIPKSDAGVSPSAIPANLYKKSKHKDSKRKKKKKKKTSKSKKEKPIPILPVNPPRHIPPKRKGKKTARPKKKRHSASIAKQPSEATSTVDNIEKESIDKAALPEAPVNSYSGELSTTLEPQSVSLEAPKDANQAQHQDVVEVPLPPLKPESSKEMATPKAIGRNRTFKFPTNSPRASVRGVRSHHVSQGSSPRRASQGSRIEIEYHL